MLAIDVTQETTVDFAGAAGAKGGPLADVGWDLAYLYHEYKAHDASNSVSPFRTDESILKVADDRVLIDASPSGSMKAAENDLRGLGMQITGAAGYMISGYLPIDEIPALAALASVKFANPDFGGPAHAGSVTSQGDATIAADAATKYLGVDGTGVTVGVLSDSYNHLGGAQADIASGDLPAAGVNVIEDDNSLTDTDEGRAMLQIVHDVAPGAALDFATGEGGQASFAENIAALKNAGAKVIVDDLQYYAEPMFQDGVVAQAVESAVNSGVVYASAAGNEGTSSLQSQWNIGRILAPGAISSAAGAPTFRGGETFDFDPSPTSSTDMQSITLQPGATATISLQWDSPFYSVSGGAGSQNDLDIYLLNAAGNQIIAGSTINNTGGDPVEILQYKNVSGTAMNANLMITTYSGADPGLIKYVLFQGGAPVTINDFSTNSGTIYGHANSSNDLAVGAEYWNSSPATLETYSSVGNTPILFDTSGNRVSITRNHADVIAPDGVSTTMSGFSPFYGTSAAAPHVAGLAALMLQSDSSATPAQVATAMEQTALDMGAPGYDYATGYGLVQAPQAILALGGHNTLTIDGTNDSSADAFKITRSGSNDQFYKNGVLLLTGAVSGISSIVVKGSSYNDSLNIDATGGNPIPSGGISYNGGSGSNSLSVTADANFTETSTGWSLTGNMPGTIAIANVAQTTLTGGPSVNFFTLTGGIITVNQQAADKSILDDASVGPGYQNTFTSYPGHADFDGSGFTYHVNGPGNVTANGTGWDTAYLYDTNGQATLDAHASMSFFHGAAGGQPFNDNPVGFGTVYATSSNASDVANMDDYGSSGVVFSNPANSIFEGSNWHNIAIGFQHVNMTSYNSSDTANLSDEGNNGRFTWYPTYAYISGAGYDNVAYGFHEVQATSYYPSVDVADVHDTLGGARVDVGGSPYLQEPNGELVDFSNYAAIVPYNDSQYQDTYSSSAAALPNIYFQGNWLET